MAGKNRYFMVIVEGGHMGIGRSYEMTRYFEAEDPIHAFDSARSMPRAKKKPGGLAVKLVVEISREQYEIGKAREARDPYLRTFGRRRSCRHTWESMLKWENVG